MNKLILEVRNNPQSACRQHGGHKISLMVHHMSSEETSAFPSTMFAAKVNDLAVYLNCFVRNSLHNLNIRVYSFDDVSACFKRINNEC